MIYLLKHFSIKNQITNPVTGDTIYFIQTAEETDGKLSEFILRLAPKASWAKRPRHFHPYQTETFEVLTGELNLTAGDKHYVLKPNDQKVIVHPFILHSFWNDSDVEVKFKAEIFPVGTIEKGIRKTYELAQQGKVSQSNIPYNPFYTLILMDYVESYFSFIPWKMQRFFFKSGSRFAKWIGYH